MKLCAPLALVCLALAFTAAAESPDTSAGAVQLTFLANEGFLLSAGERQVLIDGFVRQPYLIYGAVPEAVFRRLLEGDPPFDGIELALASHVHRDHFQGAAAAEFLRHQPRTLLATSPEVLDALTEAGFAATAARRLLPAPGDIETIEVDGILVEVLRLRHGSDRHRERHNLGHIIHLGGRKVLHIGDADTDPTVFAPYDLPAQDLDVALVPYWFYLSTEGLRTVRDHLRARHQVAVHIPPAELDEVRAHLKKSFPEVIVFGEALESRDF